MSDNIDELKEWFDSLSDPDKKEIIRHVIECKPAGCKLRDIVGDNSGVAGFDLDLADGLLGERAFLNLATTGKYEAKTDYKVGKTGNVAVERECTGRPSGISTTRAPFWLIWFSGEEFQDEVGVVISTKRLKELILPTCTMTYGGDDGRALLCLVPKCVLLCSKSELKRRQKNPQFELFEVPF